MTSAYGAAAVATVIVVVLRLEAAGEPLSVAVKVTVKVIPDWLWDGVKEKVPEAGFPVTVGNVMPETSPVAERLRVLAGTSLSVPVTTKVAAEPTGAATVDGAETTGEVLTSFTMIFTLPVLFAPKLSCAVNVTV